MYPALSSQIGLVISFFTYNAEVLQLLVQDRPSKFMMLPITQMAHICHFPPPSSSETWELQLGQDEYADL